MQSVSYIKRKATECSQSNENRLTVESLNGQNFGFPFRLYLINWVPFFKAMSAFKGRDGS